MKALIEACRPHQWVKNLLVFLPMLAGHRFQLPVPHQSVLAFVAFCLVASSVYLVNDLLDVEADRAHPRKRNRAIASGRLSETMAKTASVLLFAGGSAIAFYLGLKFFAVIVIYFLLTTAYSVYLKRKVIIDIFTLAGLYTTRMVAGAAATATTMSVWLLAFSIFFFFALAAIKRQAELVSTNAAGETELKGRGYEANDEMLIAAMAIASGYLSVLVLALYVNSEQVRALYSYPPALWGVCCILFYWVSRISMITHRGNMHDDPIVFALRDRTSYLCGAAVVACMAAGVLL